MLGEKPSFIACHNLPLQHGMTVGELAELFRRELKLSLRLRVIAVEGWKRQQWLDETGLTWRNPSPNMRSLDAATLYPGTGLLEPTNVSVGRGTETPFQILGAPWIKSAPLATRLTELNLPGVKISAHDFMPTTSVHEGKSCGGIRIAVTDRKTVPAVRLGMEIIAALWELHPADFQIDKANGLLRHSPTLAMLKRRESTAGIMNSWESEVTAFRKRRQGVLLYQ
jgi:uncharacterized protein YbbC (DUF1343 family)